MPVHPGPPDHRCRRKGDDSMADAQYDRERQHDEVSGWALSGIVFAACMMVMIGTFQAIAGLVAIFDDSFYVVTRNYTFDLDVTAWGWIHLLIGLLILGTGFGLFGRQTWAGV